jgi:extracellular factor (EF) 3-hydroxypalmitic acid methyl ester biosynthesis protein
MVNHHRISATNETSPTGRGHGSAAMRKTTFLKQAADELEQSATTPSCHANILRQISSVFQAAVEDVVSVLEQITVQADRVESSLSALHDPAHAQAEQQALSELQATSFPVLDEVMGKFEQVCAQLPPELDALHHLLIRLRLHPYLMQSPFMRHIYAKPLGYAGDYAALEKLLADPFEGETLFARIINAWLVLTPAGDAYRHRVETLAQLLTQRVDGHYSQPMRVLSLGCGAAPETARFISKAASSDHADFTLVDFNTPTLEQAQRNVNAAIQTSQHHQTSVRAIKRSVQTLVAEDCRTRRAQPQAQAVIQASAYDLVYCTGLFDYFSDRTCERLTQMLYRSLSPGGTLLVCNFTPANPIRHFMNLALDWKLIHRTAEQLQSLLPSEATSSDFQLFHSSKEVEVYLQLTKTASVR